MKHCMTFVFLLVMNVIAAQNIGNGDGITTDLQAGIVIRDVPIEGSAYVNDLYTQGVVFVGGISKREALMRYDAYNEAVELLDENGRARKLLRRKNIKAIFDDTTYEVIEYLADSKIKFGYFNPLNAGYAVLYFRPKKIFLQAENPDNGYDTYDPPRYEDMSSYYLKRGNQPAMEVKLHKRHLLRTLVQNTDEVNKFIKTYQLNLKNETDVIRLLDHYNSLLTQKEENTQTSPF